MLISAAACNKETAPHLQFENAIPFPLKLFVNAMVMFFVFSSVCLFLQENRIYAIASAGLRVPDPAANRGGVAVQFSFSKQTSK